MPDALGRWVQRRAGVEAVSAMKEIWIAAHEELIEEYLNEHPDATHTEAYHATADHVDDHYKNNLGDMIDAARMRAKYGH
jgi:hypothetical protein